MSRVWALVAKEMLDLQQNAGLFVPAMLTGFVTIIIPFFITVILPAVTGERLSDSSDFKEVAETYSRQPGMVPLDPEGTVQAWILQQFLILLVLTPVAASMSIAAASVVGEKQARTLEPLLATPITTLELLAGKVLGALLPALALSAATYIFYIVIAALFAEPGVYRVLLTPRSLAVVFGLGPLASLAALQLAVCVSSRVNDARSAQQIGALVILPIGALLVAQVVGTLVLSIPVVLAIAAGLLALNVVVMAIAVALFDRESILTRWR